MERFAKPRRRFRIYDGMILIAAVAVGMAAIPFYLPEAIDIQKNAKTPKDMFVLCVYLVLGCLPIVSLTGVGLGISRLLPPRPTGRCMARQPGFTVYLANAFAMAWVIIIAVTISISGKYSLRGFSIHTGELAKIFTPMLIGPSVVCSWALLVIGQRWRPEPSWIDRSGRLLGAFWILWFVLEMILLLGIN